MKQNDKIFEIKRLAKQDLENFKSLITIFNTVFEEAESNIQSDTNLIKLLNNDNFIAIAAISENEVVGGLTAYELPLYYSANSEVFLYDMAVKTEYQRIGIGKQLMSGLKDYCNKNGIEVFFVLAHEEDEHAIEFYHSTGGKSEKVMNFLYTTEN